MRVLVAEDHLKLAEAVAAGLRREGMAGPASPTMT
jgi:DNA-binding response OmpR family regulator